MLSNWIVYSIGFVAQLLFSARTIYQWLSSEKKKEVVAPRFFWQVSLFASFLLFIYGYLRNDFAIMLGQSLTYFIYIRNIQLENHWRKFPLFTRVFLFIFPLLFVLFYFSNNSLQRVDLFNKEEISTFLITLGVLSQLLFVSRFIYQWVYSERRKQSSLPKGFWLLSLAGASLILLYAILRKDPVLIVGHSFGLFVYLRNLNLLKK